jgi:DNA polymerase III sliding clamp (beta) subunit (PCNA family)
MKVSELKRAVELVKPGIAKKEIIEQTTCVAFRKDHLFTFNDEVAVVVPLNSDITGAVPSDPLYKFLGKLPPDEEIKIEEQENELRFSCKRNRAGIRRSEDIKMLIDEWVPEPEEWVELNDKFSDSLRRVLFSCAIGGHKPILTCVHITDEFLESCDGFRLTRISCRMEPGHGANADAPMDLRIIGKSLESLPSYSPIQFGFTDNWIHFRNKDKVRYCVRLREAQYPDMDRFMEVQGSLLEFPDISNAIQWASIITDDTIKLDQTVDVILSKGKMTIRGEGPNGWAEESIRMKYSGDDITFMAHPIFLVEMVKLAQKVILGGESIKVEGDEGGFVHVVSLGVNQ